MIADGYAAWSASTGPSFIPALSNADVAILAFALFAVCFALAAFLAQYWLADVSFLVLVAGGILVAWPAMIVLSMAAMLAAVLLSFLHQWLRPAQAAAVEAEASSMSNAILRRLADEPGLRGDASRLLRERAVDPHAERRSDP
jgi:hypothetical protein